MKKLAVAAAGAGATALAAVAVPLMVVPVAGTGLGVQADDLAPSSLAVVSVPPSYLALYRSAATTCPGLSWTVLAGIGEVETDHGRVAAPGVTSGANDAGAEGPMQMKPEAFAAYDPPDAVYAAARMLCSDDVTHDLRGALFAYNHAGWYVDEVGAWAARYGQASDGAAGPAAYAAVQYALSVVGTPYVWGGDTPGGGFDCSGLVQWSYAQAGLVLPRVAQAQHDALSAVPAGGPLAVGDLVFFGSDATHVDHVGIYVGDGRMVDAPHTGAAVRVEPVAGFRPHLVGSAAP